jgi:hypothetical protein
MARYKRLMCPEEIRIVERGNECAVQFVWLLAEKVEPPRLIDTCVAWLVTIGRRGTERIIKPLRVEFQRPKANRRLYEEYFGCSLKFAERHNRLDPNSFFRAFHKWEGTSPGEWRGRRAEQ